MSCAKRYVLKGFMTQPEPHHNIFPVSHFSNSDYSRWEVSSRHTTLCRHGQPLVFSVVASVYEITPRIIHGATVIPAILIHARPNRAADLAAMQALYIGASQRDMTGMFLYEIVFKV